MNNITELLYRNEVRLLDNQDWDAWLNLYQQDASFWIPPLCKLNSLPKADQYLKLGVTFEQLDAIAYASSDNEAAQHLNRARAQLFRSINNAQQPAT